MFDIDCVPITGLVYLNNVMNTFDIQTALLPDSTVFTRLSVSNPDCEATGTHPHFESRTWGLSLQIKQNLHLFKY